MNEYVRPEEENKFYTLPQLLFHYLKNRPKHARHILARGVFATLRLCVKKIPPTPKNKTNVHASVHPFPDPIPYTETSTQSANPENPPHHAKITGHPAQMARRLSSIGRHLATKNRVLATFGQGSAIFWPPL